MHFAWQGAAPPSPVTKVGRWQKGCSWIHPSIGVIAAPRVLRRSLPRRKAASGVADVTDNGTIQFGDQNADSLSIRFSETGAFGTYNLIRLDFVDPNGMALSSNDLIAAPDLTFFDGVFSVQGQEHICLDNFDFACLPPETDLYGEITTVAIVPEPEGDFNGDSSVDAADYVVWRKNDGSPAGYNEWRANFGNTSGSGSLASVPEPNGLMLIAVASILFCGTRQRKT